MSIIKDTVSLTVSKSARSVIMMLLVMILSRRMDIATYGVYRQLMTLSYIVLAIAPLGIPISVSYYYKNLQKEKRDSLVWNTILLCGMCSLICALFLTVFKDVIADTLNVKDYRRYVVVFSFYCFIIAASSFLENLYVSSNNAKYLSVFNITYFIIYFIVVIIQILINPDLLWIFLTMSIVELLKYMVYLTWIIKEQKCSFNVDFSFLKEQFLYCIPLGIVSIMQTLSNYIDKLSVSSFFTSEMYAVYSTGAMDIPLISLITLSFSTASLPNMSKEYNTNNNINAVLDIWGKVTASGALIIFPVFWILMFYSKGYIEFLFSKKYLICIPVFLIYLIKLPLTCTVFGNVLIVIGKQKVIIFNLIITVIVSLLGNVVLIPIMGLQGAALSGVIMRITIVLLQLYQISRYTKLSIKRLLPYKMLCEILASSFIVTAIIYFFSSIFKLNNILQLMVFGSLTMCFCLITFIYLKLIDINAVVKMLKVRINI